MQYYSSNMSMGERLAYITCENDSFTGARYQAVHSFHLFLVFVLDDIVRDSWQGRIISGTVSECQE